MARDGLLKLNRDLAKLIAERKAANNQASRELLIKEAGEALIGLLTPLLTERIIEARGKDGNDGKPGKDAQPVDEEKLVRRILGQIRVPKDGDPGLPGKDADENAILQKILKKIPRVKELNEDDLVKTILSKLPKIEPVQKVDEEEIVKKVLDKLPKTPNKIMLGSGSQTLEVKNQGSTLTRKAKSINFGSNLAATVDGVGNVSVASTASGGASALDDLTDVVLTSPSDGQALVYDGANWVNETLAGSGDVVKVGTPVDNQVGVWTGDGTLEGDAALTFDTTTNTLSTDVLTLTGTGTLNGLDAMDATTEATIEAAIDTLANLTSVQGFTVTLADAGADAILGWDDSAAAYENLTQAEVLAVIGDSSATAKGVVELATDAETVTGTDTVRATTPANIAAKMAAPGTIGGTTPGAATFTTLVGTTINGNTITTGTGVLTLAASKTLTASNTITLSGTDGVAMNVTNNKLASIGISIDGAGSAITTGVKGDIYVPYACTITAVTMLADQSGSIVVDVWKDTYANYPPTDADSITASAPPTISTATKSQDTTLTSWTTSVSAGDTLRFNVDSATTITRLNLVLTVVKT